jgi:hypothetical protein
MHFLCDVVLTVAVLQGKIELVPRAKQLEAGLATVRLNIEIAGLRCVHIHVVVAHEVDVKMLHQYLNQLLLVSRRVLEGRWSDNTREGAGCIERYTSKNPTVGRMDDIEATMHVSERSLTSSRDSRSLESALEIMATMNPVFAAKGGMSL